MPPSIVRAEPVSAAARRAMVDNQIRTYDVTDKRLLAAFEAVPRELFLPPELADLAYSDAALTVASEQGAKRCLCAPMVLARMFQGFDLVPSDRMLIVGAGPGYAAAIAAELCGSVVALECEPDFVDETDAKLRALGLPVQAVSGPLDAGYPAGAPYNAILICGAVETELDALLGQLAAGGRLVAVQTASHEATRRSGKVVRFDRIGDEVSSRVLFDATLPVLDAFREVPAFTF